MDIKKQNKLNEEKLLKSTKGTMRKNQVLLAPRLTGRVEKSAGPTDDLRVGCGR